MEGVQSFEQRSLGDFDSRGNRVIIFNRREPQLDWQATSEHSGRLQNMAVDGGGPPYLGNFCSMLFCCSLWGSCCCQTSKAATAEKSQSRGKWKRKFSDTSSLKYHSSQVTAKASFDLGPFPSNVWKTSKYTFMNFLPKNLFEQFRRLANFYFLITAIVQVVIPFSPIGPSTSLIPLAFVVSTTAVKQAYEDYLRHKLDNEVNNRTCCVLRGNKHLVKVRSKDIRVGDIVYVKNNEEIPCDMILLASSGSGDRCYITTANLDGETSLKGRTCFAVHQQVGPIERINETMLVVECEKPNATLYEFNGFLRAPKDEAAYERLMSDLKHLDEFRSGGGSVGNQNSSTWQSKKLTLISTIFQRIKQTNLRTKLSKHLTTEQLKQIGADYLVESRSEHIEIPLDISNLLLRASRLRNTNFVYGLAIYTGPDTRLAHNSQVKPNKFSSLESRVNMFLAIAFVLLLMLTLVGTFRYQQPSQWYLSNLPRADSFVEILMAHFVLYNYLVPISLYVTLEFVKFLGTISVLEDKKLQAYVWTSMTVSEGTPEDQQAAQQNKQKHTQKHIKRLVGPQCNSSDLNEDLGQVEVLFSDKTGTLTENKMLFMACSIHGQIFRSIANKLHEQPEGLCYMPTLNVARKLSNVSTNRYGALAAELAQHASPRSDALKSVGGGSRSSRSSLDMLAKLPAHQRPFDHRLAPPMRELKSVETPEQHHKVTEFLISLCLCSTISLNEQKALEECLPRKSDSEAAAEQYDYQSASPDEESLISAAARFGVIVCKSSERECFIAVKRPAHMQKGPTAKATVSPGEPRQMHNFKPLVETKHSNEHFLVRQFERLITFEFNSVRKKMSVLYRDCDNDCYVIFTKGSESVLDCIGIAPGPKPNAFGPAAPTNDSSEKQHHGDRVLNATLAHFEAFSKSGLRTMLVAKRVVSGQEYEKINREMRENRALSSPEMREQRMAHMYRRVESNMDLIGATAVEDSLQDGVPETIANLKEAGIKVWLLTGDKVETAISVAYLCKLLDRNMNLLNLVRQQDSNACKELLHSFSKRIKAALLYGDEDDSTSPAQSVSKWPQPHPKLHPASIKTISGRMHKSLHQMRSINRLHEMDMPRFALIADGRSLHYAMKYAKRELEFVSTNCVCVLGCRLSPLQKAEIVDMIKNSAGDPITAAIGDGANDVSMIQEAHVGIGISGKEGRQAVNSSDFAINRFHMLSRLFFVHGHLFYHRTANTIHYFFYKNLVFIMPQFLYSFYNLSSATSLYHPIILISYNMLFTSFPILLYGLFEVNIAEGLLESYPRLYRINSRNKKMQYSAFLAWLLMGTLQALIAFYFLKIIWGSHTPFLESGKMAGVIGFSTILFSALIFGVTLKLYFISKHRSYSFDLAAALSCLILPLTLYTCSLFDMSHLFDDNSLYRQFFVLLKSPTYWLAILSTTAAIVVPDMILYVREQIVYYKTLNSVVV